MAFGDSFASDCLRHHSVCYFPHFQRLSKKPRCWRAFPHFDLRRCCLCDPSGLVLGRCLCGANSRSWELADRIRQGYRLAEPGVPVGANPSRLICCDHSAGASRRAATPIPRGNRPSTAAVTSVGARKASEIVILICRVLQCCLAARLSMVSRPSTIS